MSIKRSPCETCACCMDDYRKCKPYRDWLQDYWLRLQQFVPRDYWDYYAGGDVKLKYVHPDVLRRYLRDGPCGRCPCESSCGFPCKQYLCWYDARMAWLKWHMQHQQLADKREPLPDGRGVFMIRIRPA